MALRHEIHHHVHRNRTSATDKAPAEKSAFKYVILTMGVFEPLVKVLSLSSGKGEDLLCIRPATPRGSGRIRFDILTFETKKTAPGLDQGPALSEPGIKFLVRYFSLFEDGF